MRRILLVDDTQTVRAVEKVFLGREYEFLEAVNGAAALELAEERAPDLILLDVMMPVLNGLETLRELKRRERTKSIPVIMVTTRGEAEVRAECESLGCDAFTTKPINRDELRARVTELLPK